MLNIKNAIITDYPVLYPYASRYGAETWFEKQPFLVVADEESFHGILIPRDLVERNHILVADCLTEKPTFPSSGRLFDAYTVMKDNSLPALAVVDEKGNFVGPVSINSIAQVVFSTFENDFDSPSVVINIEDDAKLSLSEMTILSQLAHHLFNPLQVISSSAHLLLDSGMSKEQKMFVRNILKTTSKMNTLVSSLLQTAKV